MKKNITDTGRNIKNITNPRQQESMQTYQDGCVEYFIV